MQIADIKSRIPSQAIAAFKSGHLGDATLEAAISHAILMVIQSRQTGETLVPIDFDICDIRIATFRAIAGRDSQA